VQGSWVITTEPKGRPTEPRKGGLGLGGYGALELALRFDKMGFDGDAGQDPPFRNSRAETVFPNSDRVWTAGLTYWANRWVKIQLNAIHENIEDAERAPTPIDTDTTKPKFWTIASLMQVEF
jgi:phosphate-selective porin